MPSLTRTVIEITYPRKQFTLVYPMNSIICHSVPLFSGRFDLEGTASALPDEIVNVISGCEIALQTKSHLSVPS
jgi:hypothetical protein